MSDSVRAYSRRCGRFRRIRAFGGARKRGWRNAAFGSGSNRASNRRNVFNVHDPLVHVTLDGFARESDLNGPHVAAMKNGQRKVGKKRPDG